MKKNISTKQSEANIAKVMALLLETSLKLKNLSSVLSDEQFGQPLGTGERTITQILAHLQNCEARSSENITLALLKDEPNVLTIHPERELGKLLRYDQIPFLDLLAYFLTRRTVLLQILGALTSEQWSRTIRQEGRKRSESVYLLARTLALHEHGHLLDIEDRLNLIN